MNRTTPIATLMSVVPLVLAGVVEAEVIDHQINERNRIVHVKNDPWQPQGFSNGREIPASYLHASDIVIDGDDGESSWGNAKETEVVLRNGPARFASVKAVYTDDEVFIRVRWADADEDRQYRPWVWDAALERYVEGSQLEDSVMLSFEAGCEWEPSFFAGYIFDFDAWQWHAARTDPLGQAVDLYGNVQDQQMGNPLLIRYASRQTEDSWNIKFTDNANPDLHATWNQLDRVYMLQPLVEEVFVQAVPDGRDPPPFYEQVAAPASFTGQVIPQYAPLTLTDGAGEVQAKGQWRDGYWTVEFRRDRETPARTLNDTVFNRLVQFSVYVFDGAERLDEASESERLFLRFLPGGQELVSN